MSSPTMSLPSSYLLPRSATWRFTTKVSMSNGHSYQFTLCHRSSMQGTWRSWPNCRTFPDNYDFNRGRDYLQSPEYSPQYSQVSYHLTVRNISSEVQTVSSNGIRTSLQPWGIGQFRRHLCNCTVRPEQIINCTSKFDGDSTAWPGTSWFTSRHEHKKRLIKIRIQQHALQCLTTGLSHGSYCSNCDMNT
jgi:hypothetical protein